MPDGPCSFGEVPVWSSRISVACPRSEYRMQPFGHLPRTNPGCGALPDATDIIRAIWKDRQAVIFRRRWTVQSSAIARRENGSTSRESIFTTTMLRLCAES